MARKLLVMRRFLSLLLLLFAQSVYSQVANTGMIDTNEAHAPRRLTVDAYAEGYYAWDFSQPASGNRLYAVNHHRHNEMNINVAFLDIKYNSGIARARIMPAVGTYMIANYRGEPEIARNLAEATVGFRLKPGKNIWIDAGVFGSPITNESFISKDHLMLTRSLASEYVPYYLSGVRLALPLNDKLKAYFYYLTGWQVIKDNNSEKAGMVQLEYRPTGKLLLNWNGYYGGETTVSTGETNSRFFTDVYAIYNLTGSFSLTSSLFAGFQPALYKNQDDYFWWSANLIGRLRLNPRFSLSARGEYLDDYRGAVAVPAAGEQGKGFGLGSGSFCLNYAASEQVLLRLEARQYFSPYNNLQERSGRAAGSNTLVVAGFAVTL